MEIVTVTKRNEVHLDVKTDPGIAQEISDFFTFEVPGAKFTPMYRSRMWDGKIRLYNMMTRELYVGLLFYLEEFCKKNGYECDVQIPEIGEHISDDTLVKFGEALKLSSLGKPIEMRDYQRNAVREALRTGRSLLLSPTASGKSLIIYALLRWHQMRNRRTLIIVPTTSLVEQMYGDFDDYAANDSWNSADNVLRIYGGKEKLAGFPIVVSTWQSIYKMPKAFFDQFDVIIGDECHQFKAKALTGLLNKCTSVPYRIGTTGTLDGTKTHRLVLEGLFGPVMKVTTTKALMDAEQLAELAIKCIVFEYTDQERKEARHLTYPQELDYIVSHARRNAFIKNLALSQKGNTLVLFQFVEKHGVPLFEAIRDKAADGRKVFFVSGGTDTEDRELVRSITEKEEDAIIVASVGTFSTGINIRNLHNIIFASPSKSRIRNLQSIGRGLRRSDSKSKAKLYDLSDDLSWKSHKNYTLLHMIERVRIYAEEDFNYKVVRVPLTP